MEIINYHTTTFTIIELPNACLANKKIPNVFIITNSNDKRVTDFSTLAGTLSPSLSLSSLSHSLSLSLLKIVKIPSRFCLSGFSELSLQSLQESFCRSEIQYQYSLSRSQVGSCLVQTSGFYNMDGNASGEHSDNVDWDTDDEQEIQNFPVSSCSSLRQLGGEAIVGSAEASSSTGSSHSKLIDHFVGMGFPEKMVRKATEENGEGNTESILETLLTYSALENSPQLQEPVNFDHSSSEYDETFVDDFSDSDSFSGNAENTDPLLDTGKTMLFLTNMGYTVEEASMAMAKCGPNASIDELADFICAAQMATSYASLQDPPEEIKPKLEHIPSGSGTQKRKYFESEFWESKKQKGYETMKMNGDDETIRIPKPMVGYGVPRGQGLIFNTRSLPEAAIGPPYFYYENVAQTPKGVWDTIKRFLYDIEPEFVDSKYFCAAARKRGYIHNLPICNRFPLLPLPPDTINEVFPLTKRWWPKWDTRTKLNCLQTSVATASLTEKIRKALEGGDGEPSPEKQKHILDLCRKWNLVWVGKNKVAPLEPDEVEMLLGFPKNHTRGGGISRTDRYKSLGNSFQVDTVAYHLSVLKDLYPGGVNILSLFSGIGGAEVALHRLGIPLKNVVSVEKCEVNRNIVRSWWDQTNQKGNLIEFADVQQLNANELGPLVHAFGGFDLIIGGSPCNNLAGSNRVSRDGLEGKESALFYDYFRILDLVKRIME
ncbi:DNA (cytosine-5)-methyltransferase DRM2 isoform X2 [Rhododendron vialii]|uniref:DNA (cytosine-5)-methyltransferase DRM2 isoform X2 n=1 Tax=Rhododendron vialii TaxID=182163 RepID=UPI00265FF9A2|nr:DNA (cytosine-5)-methyltransferase DRM2 isoform X2 [Rhododendron vialii]